MSKKIKRISIFTCLILAFNIFVSSVGTSFGNINANTVLASSDFGGGSSGGGGSTGSWGLTINEDELYERTKGHIFSSDHIKKDIDKLGPSRRAIFNKGVEAVRVAETIANIVEGSYQIWTTFNGYFTTVRFFVEAGKVINLNIIPEKATRIIGELITISGRNF